MLLTTVLRGATELHITRMDLPFLLGTIVSDHRRRAKIWGYALHFAILMLNYGRNTFLVTIAAHMAYGAIVGATFQRL